MFSNGTNVDPPLPDHLIESLNADISRAVFVIDASNSFTESFVIVAVAASFIFSLCIIALFLSL